MSTPQEIMQRGVAANEQVLEKVAYPAFLEKMAALGASIETHEEGAALFQQGQQLLAQYKAGQIKTASSRMDRIRWAGEQLERSLGHQPFNQDAAYVAKMAEDLSTHPEFLAAVDDLSQAIALQQQAA